MSFEENPVALRVDHSYENEFGLVTSSAVLSFLTFGLLLTAIMPNIPWAYVATTTTDVPSTRWDEQTNTSVSYLPVTIEAFTLWDFSCDTAGMRFTYNSELCHTRYQTVEAFAILACVFSILGLCFGIMPFSPVAPREPKQALTHSMLSHLLSGLFALVAWSVFYGGLVFGVWQTPNPAISSVWKNDVLVTTGGILAVTGWVGAFLAWIFSLSAMIKYDARAAEQAILAHKQRKERRARKKAEIIQRLGEGAFRAAHDKESIPLDLGDKLYLGGTVAAGGTAAVAWANMSIAPYLFLFPYALPTVAGAFLIVNTVATTTAAIILMVGLSDLIPRPKASVGGFAVFATVTACWICTFGMIIHYITVFQEDNLGLLALEAAVGTVGMACALCTTVVLYHPFKIWEKDFLELPRPAKIHKGENGLALVMTSAACSLLAFCLCLAAITIFVVSGEDFVALPPKEPSTTPAPTLTGECTNFPGAVCNVGTEAERCCPAPYQCIESSFTHFTCEYVDTSHKLVGIRDAFTVGQAFLALTIAFSAVAYVFSALALCPNGAMDIKAALSVVWTTGLCAFACCVVTFSVLQGYVLASGGAGMPIECGYLLGSFFVQSIGAACAFAASRAYHGSGGEQATTSTGALQDQLFRAQRELELERTRLEIAQTKAERAQLEQTLETRAQQAAVASAAEKTVAGHYRREFKSSNNDEYEDTAAPVTASDLLQTV